MTRSALLAALLAAFSLSACGTIKRTVGAIPVPSLSGVRKLLPSVEGVRKMLPDLSSDDSTGRDDPFHSFDPRRSLGFGDTLRMVVYEGVREPSEVYKGLLMVDRSGVVEFEDIGTARFGGHSAMEARSMAESVLRGAGHTAGKLHVHLVSIENVELIAVQGNVANGGVFRFREGMRVSDVIAAAGGRAQTGTSRAVYVTHRGMQRFFTSEAAANGARLEAGDIITVSGVL